MKWFRKSQKVQPPESTVDVHTALKLSVISLSMYFVPYEDKEKYSAEVIYYQHPEKGYSDRGTRHEVRINTDTWPEMRRQIDQLLTTPRVWVRSRPLPSQLHSGRFGE